MFDVLYDIVGGWVEVLDDFWLIEVGFCGL